MTMKQVRNFLLPLVVSLGLLGACGSAASEDAPETDPPTPPQEDGDWGTSSEAVSTDQTKAGITYSSSHGPVLTGPVGVRVLWYGNWQGTVADTLQGRLETF